MKNTKFHDDLKANIDEYVHSVYNLTKKLPKEELFGITSQLRRSALSVALNYIEGYARRRKAVLLNFLEISYGSLQESKYLLHFAYKQNYITENEWQKADQKAHTIGGMLWGILKNLS